MPPSMETLLVKRRRRCSALPNFYELYPGLTDFFIMSVFSFRFQHHKIQRKPC